MFCTFLFRSRNKIQVSKEEALEKVTEWEMINQKLKSELRETAQQLIAKSNELTSSKVELQKHRQEIDVSGSRVFPPFFRISFAESARQVDL